MQNLGVLMAHLGHWVLVCKGLLFDTQMQTSLFILINGYGTSMVQIPNVTTIKLDPVDNNYFVLSHFEDDVCPVMDL